MALLNYTTEVSADRSVSQILALLVSHGARAIMTNYDAGQVCSISFQIETPQGLQGFRLPVDPDAVLKVMQKQKRPWGKIPPRYVNQGQAIRIAWRILKDWVEAQMAIIETEMVRMEEVFLPYLLVDKHQTLFQKMVGTRFQLPQGSQESP